jgi:ribosomal-protein-alanine N-acetyltransferase
VTQECGAAMIATRRFLLRDFAPADRSAFLAYHADPRYLALYGPEEAAPGHASGLLQTFALWAAERPRRNWQLAAVWREGEVPLGCGGLRCAGCEEGSAEIGVELAPAYWGHHGVALEIARALIGFGFGELGLERLFGVTTSANARAGRLAGWFGATQIGSRPGPAWMQARGWTVTTWQVSRETWSGQGKGGAGPVQPQGPGRRRP